MWSQNASKMMYVHESICIFPIEPKRAGGRASRLRLFARLTSLAGKFVANSAN